MKPRDYQATAVANIFEEWKTHPATLVVQPTGTGKTVVFALVIQQAPARSIVVAHREELIHQAAGKIHAVTGEAPEIEMNVNRADSHIFARSKCVVASIQTLLAQDGARLKKFRPQDFGQLIIDECFVAGTVVDGRPIESFVVGDWVSCHDHKTGLASGQVTHVFKSKPASLVRVHLHDGPAFICTPFHPVWSQSRGRYVPAVGLDGDDMVSRLTTYAQQNMHRLRNDVSAPDQASTKDVFESVPSEGFVGDGGVNQPKVCLCENEEAKSDAPCGHSPKSFGDNASDGSRASVQGRQRDGAKRTREETGRGVGVDNRVEGSYQCEENQPGTSSDTLQDRRCERTDEDRRRSRWWFSQDAESSGTGCEEGSVFEAVRVDRVEILEPGCDGTFGGLCPDGFVYNLEVARHSNYFANGVLVHNCHHAVADGYATVIEHFRQNKDLRVLGVTATPDRSDEQAMGKVFGSCAFEYGIIDAINDGWLVPITQKMIDVRGLDYSSVRTTAGDLNGADLANVMASEEILHQMVSATIQETRWRKVIMFAPPGFKKSDSGSFRVSERISEIFDRQRAGCVRLVSQDTPTDDRKQILRDFHDGRFQVLLNVGVFTEGFDEPSIEVVSCGRATKSRSLYSQMIGRGTRPLPGLVDGLETAAERRAAIAASDKPGVIVLDFCGNSGKHKLVTATDVLAGNYDDKVIERAEQMAKKDGDTKDVRERLAEAQKYIDDEDKIKKQAEMERRRAIIGKAKYTATVVDPFDVFDLSPVVQHGYDLATPPSEAQLKLLVKNGIPTNGVTKKRATQLIGELMRRWNTGECSFKQAKILSSRGYETKGVTHAKAKEIIDSIAQTEGWGNRKKVTA